MMDQALDMAKIAYEALDEKKGEAIKVIDISQISVIADYFISTNGSSDSQVKALRENVQERLARVGHHPKRAEGNRSGTWVLLDYGDIIVHVFDKENRSFYNLERTWSDGTEVEM